MIQTLVWSCMAEVTPLILYLILWILMFALTYKVLGLSVKESDYPGLSINYIYIMIALENCLGQFNYP